MRAVIDEHFAEDDVADDFWRRVYNIGGGETCRVGYVDYLDRIFGTLGIGRLNQLTQRNWFALQNFHLQYYLDSDVLERYLHFRRDSLDDYVAHMAASAPWRIIAWSVDTRCELRVLR